MSSRIELYAVDIARFEELFNRSIGAVMHEYARHGTDRESIIVWHDWPRDRRYIAVPKLGVMYAVGSGDYRPADTPPDDPFLARQTRDYLREQDSSYALSSLLRGLSRFPPVDFVREITWGHRRWWIGSLLDYAENSPAITPGEYARLVQLWQKVLRGYDCGKPIPESQFTLADFDFPVLPSDDTDLWIGAWTEEEARFMVGFLRRIRAERPGFRQPPGKVGMAPDKDEEWAEWVNEMLDALLLIEEALIFDRLAVVSFIF